MFFKNGSVNTTLSVVAHMAPFIENTLILLNKQKSNQTTPTYIKTTKKKNNNLLTSFVCLCAHD